MNIEKCPEGHEAIIKANGINGLYAECGDTDGCWAGPVCYTPEEAIEKWNRVMRIFHGHEALRDAVRHAIPPEGE